MAALGVYMPEGEAGLRSGDAAVSGELRAQCAQLYVARLPLSQLAACEDELYLYISGAVCVRTCAGRAGGIYPKGYQQGFYLRTALCGALPEDSDGRRIYVGCFLCDGGMPCAVLDADEPAPGYSSEAGGPDACHAGRRGGGGCAEHELDEHHHRQALDLSRGQCICQGRGRLCL